MRQGDGSELLGVNDSRSANIGVIHVAPNDDRQSVLAAILTQDKLGRKQVAIVLPEQNKAFQRPVDFDGLKNMRRGLKTQIVFVAAGGPGPAEFARQRRFPVFSSLDNYAQSLQAEGQSSVNGKKGMFGRRQKFTRANGNVTPSPSGTTTEHEPAHPLPDSSMAGPEQGSARIPDEQHHQDYSNAPLIGAAGLGAGLGLGALAEHESSSSTFKSGDDDWDALPPPAQEPQPAESSFAAGAPEGVEEESTLVYPRVEEQSNEPGIIAFPPPRPRTTGKLSDRPPVPAIVPMPEAQANIPVSAPPPRRRSSRRMAAVGAGGAALAGLGAGSVLAAHSASTGSAPPPTTTNVGGPPGGGSRRRNRRRLLALLLILLTLLLLAGIAFAAPGGGLIPRAIFGTPPGATVTITPTSKDLKDTFVISGVTGPPDTSKRQVGARLLSYTTPSQMKTAPATGTGHTNPTQARGTLTFYNALTFSQTVASNTVLRGADGVQVENVQLAVIPAAHLPTEGFVTVAAIAVQAGATGNIKAYDVSGTCCLSGVTVYNTSAFSGGQDGATFTAVQQSDIDGAANALKTSLTPGAQKSFQSQIHANEQLVSPAQCTSNVASDHQAGDKATSVTVTVSVTCKGEVYDRNAALALATNLLKTEASKNPGAGYALVGNIVTGISQATIIDANGTVSLLVKAEGVWVYDFNTALKQKLARLIAGKSKKDAQAFLLLQPGVSAAQISIANGSDTLPTDPSQISIIIVPVSGVKGTATPTTSGTPGGTSTPGGPTATPTSQPGLGGS